MFNAAAIRRDWFSNVRADILAGIVVALALIPEAIGFSIIAGVDPRVGLYASVTIAIVIAFTGGRPGMISAATAAVAVVVVPLVRDHGVEYLFAATILMGIFQGMAAILRLNLLMQFVSRSVITGFVNALAILIFMAQLPQLIGVTWETYAMVIAGLPSAPSVAPPRADANGRAHERGSAPMRTASGCHRESSERPAGRLSKAAKVPSPADCSQMPDVRAGKNAQLRE